MRWNEYELSLFLTLSDISAAQIRKQVQHWRAEHAEILHSDRLEQIC